MCRPTEICVRELKLAELSAHVAGFCSFGGFCGDFIVSSQVAVPSDV